jgi:pimeloyl-ACP methyl ester carboxylesterase
MTTTATERTIEVSGLAHHVITWGDGDGTPVLLCHGFLDLAWGWDRVARRLADQGYVVTAFDWRGHGESEWVGRGGYYHFPDYVLDLSELLKTLRGPAPHLVGHSMGGTACSLFAGTCPDAIRSLTLVEGLGPPAHPAALTPDRFGAWMRGVEKMRGREGTPMNHVEDVLTRMRVQNPELDDEWGTFLATKATKPGPEGRGLVFRFDPLHRTTSPVPFRLSAYRAFLGRITVPALIIGGTRGFRVDGEAERASEIADRRTLEIEDVGHMIHWFAPDRLSEALVDFFALADVSVR